jgi:hypothetical protein
MSGGFASQTSRIRLERQNCDGERRHDLAIVAYNAKTRFLDIAAAGSVLMATMVLALPQPAMW